MFGPDDISAEFPTPRNDEPASLRQDIVDELRDHLECALVRELHAPTSRGCISADQTTRDAAHQRVLVRFGNPATIARRLWWDAVKETIMSQRISAAMSCVAALACCVVLVLVWQMQAANRALVEQSQSLNAQMLEQMQTLANNLRATSDDKKGPSEWNRLRLKCVADREDGAPLAGVEAYLSSASENTRGIPPTRLTTGEDGTLDFGQVLYGQYEIEFGAPNGMVLRRTYSVRPGQDLLETIVCPTGASLATVAFKPELQGDVKTPEALSGRVWYLCRMTRTADRKHWSRPQRDQAQEIIVCFLGPEGHAVSFSSAQMQQQERYSEVNHTNGEADPGGPTAPPPDQSFRSLTNAIWTLPKFSSASNTVLLEPGAYEIYDSAICIAENAATENVRLWQLLEPFNPPRMARGDVNPRIAIRWGQANEVEFSVPEPPMEMAIRALAASPEREVAILNFHSVGGFPRGFSPFAGQGERDPAQAYVGSRVSIYRSENARSRSERRELLMSGVEMISYRELTEGNVWDRRFVVYVLLNPEQKKQLSPFLDQLFIMIDAPDSESAGRDVESPAVPESPSGPVLEVEQARVNFGLLDADRDGTVSPPELANARRVIELFRESGIDVASSMTLDRFVENHVEATKAQRAGE